MLGTQRKRVARQGYPRIVLPLSTGYGTRASLMVCDRIGIAIGITQGGAVALYEAQEQEPESWSVHSPSARNDRDYRRFRADRAVE